MQGSVSRLSAQIDKVFERWDRPGSPGCTVGVSRNGKVVHAQGYGMANLEYGIRLDRGAAADARSGHAAVVFRPARRRHAVSG